MIHKSRSESTRNQVNTNFEDRFIETGDSYSSMVSTGIKPEIVQQIERSIIGGGQFFDGPFGSKPVVYADSTASGRALSFIEDYLRDEVLPMYANTHTEASATGLQTTHFRENARDFIRESFRAPMEDYAVLFTGSGSTGAMTKLSQVLGISPLARKPATRELTPVVFITSYEHHSNELLWRESNVDVVVIPSSATDAIDLDILQEKLVAFQDRPFRLGSFSAASNVTGIRADVPAVTKLLHRFRTFSVWDFAAAGPHTSLDMTGCDLDAVYLSTHKFVGGPGTPGLLVARRSLFQNAVPTVPGGGTVFYVKPNGHKYINDIEAREEGGTPAIMESIRAGMVLRLHDKVGGGYVETIEGEMLKRAFSKWAKNPNIVILGGTQRKRVPIVSFLIRAPGSKGLILHPNFVVAILNDLFGIQSRGGCSCAGPYGHRLLGLDQEKSEKIFNEVSNGGEVVRPGWTRIAFAYYMTEETVNYLIEAVDLVAREGYRLLPWYQLDEKTASWSHCKFQSQAKGLWDNFEDNRSVKQGAKKDKELSASMKQATQTLRQLTQAPKLACAIHLTESAERLRHFMIPEDLSTNTSDETDESSQNEPVEGEIINIAVGAKEKKTEKQSLKQFSVVKLFRKMGQRRWRSKSGHRKDFLPSREMSGVTCESSGWQFVQQLGRQHEVSA